MQNEPVLQPPAPSNKPYRVTAYANHWMTSFLVGDYCWYWQANLVSWYWHWFKGYGCNTWRKQ